MQKTTVQRQYNTMYLLQNTVHQRELMLLPPHVVSTLQKLIVQDQYTMISQVLACVSFLVEEIDKSQ
jgi:hypothetical protein